MPGYEDVTVKQFNDANELIAEDVRQLSIDPDDLETSAKDTLRHNDAAQAVQILNKTGNTLMDVERDDLGQIRKIVK